MEPCQLTLHQRAGMGDLTPADLQDGEPTALADALPWRGDLCSGRLSSSKRWDMVKADFKTFRVANLDPWR